MLLLVSTQPHTDPIKKLNDANEWDSPYSWPVRREFSRILHKPRPHFGIVYTERFLNSRPLTYFDDETKLIRAKAGAILKAVHTPIPKPSRVLRPYETLDSYRSHQLIPYGVPQHLYVQSHYNQPAHLTIGRGHLACIQFAGGKGYPRRKNLYSDENRNIRDEIKFRSYYNRPKHEDPNTLPTGFAWRLLHLPPKDDKPFKLYKQSRTLPLPESSKHEEKTSISEDKGNHHIKRNHKTYTQPLDESSNVFSSRKKSLNDRPIETYSSKIKDQVIENPPVVESNDKEYDEPEHAIQKITTEESQATDEKANVEETSNKIDKKPKKSKVDKTATENALKKSISHSKSISEDTPAEKMENDVVVPTSNKDIAEVEIAPHISENILQDIKSEINEETLVADEVTNETIADPLVDVCQTEDNKITEDVMTEDAQLNVTDDINPSNEPHEVQEAAVLEPVREPTPPVETMQEVIEEMTIPTVEKSDVSDSLEICNEIADDSNPPDVTEVKQEENSSNAMNDECNIHDDKADIEPSDHQVITDSETAQESDNTKQDETELVPCNGSEMDSDLQIRDDTGESLITEQQLDAQVVDQITEISSVQITHSSEETVMQADSSTQIWQVTEDSDKPEDLVNETDITTDEENVEISME